MSSYTLQDAIDLATFAHRKQFDKAGEPYILHPLRVLQSVQAQGAPAYAQFAAVLHDVTEDTPFTLDMLRAFGVPEAAVKIVALMDRHESKRIWETIDQNNNNEVWLAMKVFRVTDATGYYYHQIRQNHAALLVKKADIGDNTQPWRLEYLEDATRERLRAKYDKALDLLGAL